MDEHDKENVVVLGVVSPNTAAASILKPVQAAAAAGSPTTPNEVATMRHEIKMLRRKVRLVAPQPRMQHRLSPIASVLVLIFTIKVSHHIACGDCPATIVSTFPFAGGVPRSPLKQNEHSHNINDTGQDARGAVSECKEVEFSRAEALVNLQVQQTARRFPRARSTGSLVVVAGRHTKNIVPSYCLTTQITIIVVLCQRNSLPTLQPPY
jgi:hypothetical protein